MIDRLFDGTWVATRVGLEAVKPGEVVKTMTVAAIR